MHVNLSVLVVKSINTSSSQPMGTSCAVRSSCLFCGPPSHRTTNSTITSMSLRSRPLVFQNFQVSFPEKRILQITLNRPEKLNCIDKATSTEIQNVWELFDQDETLWVGIITGVGRAFCTGADLSGKLLTGTHSCGQALSIPPKGLVVCIR